MQFLIGLGNPGKEYEKTRHNLGFMLVDRLAAKTELSFSNQKKCQAEVAKQANLLIVKPQTYMNDSGLAVQAVMKFYSDQDQKFPAGEYPNLWVIFDDLDLEVGTFKIQYGTGPKVHNGLSSIYEHLKTKQFWHVRIGADGRQGDRTIPAVQYVLSSFSTEEQSKLQPVFEAITAELIKKV